MTKSADVPASVVPPQPGVEASHAITPPRSPGVVMPSSNPTDGILNHPVDILPSPPLSRHEEERVDYGSDGFDDLYDLPPLPSLPEFYPQEEAMSFSMASSTAGGILRPLHALFCLLPLIIM